MGGAALALVAVAVPLRGDSPAAAKSAAKSPLHDELARLVGDWDATVTFRMGDRESEGKARCEAKWILDGHWVRQEYNSTFMGRPLTIIQLLSYDPAKKKMVEIHLSSQQGGAHVNEGGPAAGGKEWKFTGPYVDRATGKTTELRTVYSFVDGDHFTLDWYLPGPDGKEVRGVHITHARRK
jgi:hypothetical protein